MKCYAIAVVLLLTACSSGPGRLNTLRKKGIGFQSRDTSIDLTGFEGQLFVQYTGCGGVYIQRDSNAILIDPFFSNQKVMRIGSSVFGGGQAGKKKISADPEMVHFGMQKLGQRVGSLQKILAILSAHSHYDHLLDIPAVFNKLEKKPTVYVNRSGYNTCYNVIDTSKMEILENHMTTEEVSRPPIALQNGKIHIYPILSEHNPHFRNIKFFSGSRTQPVADFTDAYHKTRANDWLEGNVFSFLIDYLDQTGKIEFRIFVQSSSCNPPAGIPPLQLLADRSVDVAFLGIVSYHFSPAYPCDVVKALNPKEIVWIHWEDFFRKYTKEPKTARGTDIPKFFDMPCTNQYKSKILMPWPGVFYEFR
jgi:L-ascorbate metabolism protein UlaG (beta-lactamase superfamily)